MDKFSQLLEEHFGAWLAEDFERRASYFSEMDFLEYVSADTTVVTDRVDSFLTLLLDAGSREVIGFRIKGFGYVFQKFIKPVMKLHEDDFDPIVRGLELAFTKFGDEMFPKPVDTDDQRRLKAYKDSIQLAKRDKVTLPLELAA